MAREHPTLRDVTDCLDRVQEAAERWHQLRLAAADKAHADKADASPADPYRPADTPGGPDRD